MSQKLVIRAEGSVHDGGLVRLADFLSLVQSVRSCLRVVENILPATRARKTPLRIVGLRAGSAQLELAAAPGPQNQVGAIALFSGFTSALRILKNGANPEHFDEEALETFKALASPLKHHVRAIWIGDEHDQIEIDHRFPEQIEALLGGDQETRGSLLGYLDVVNVHAAPVIQIFPEVGPKKVSCTFPEHLLDHVKTGIGRYVEVRGQLVYRRLGRFPYRMTVEHLTVFPPESQLPTLSSLRGLAPDLTGGLESVAYLQRIRDASDN